VAVQSEERLNLWVCGGVAVLNDKMIFPDSRVIDNE